jgi:hypothetical protein
MRRTHLSIPLAAICMVAAFAVAGGAASANATRDRPPPAHTGGFGEPSCQYCHTEAPENSGPGSLAVSGLPDGGYIPGEVYPLVIRLADPQLRVAGFQLAIRFHGGAQAGRLEAGPEDARRVGVTIAGDIAYAHHLYDGTIPRTPGSAVWILRWTAPTTRGAVHIHAAAVAGDGDLSNLGDFVYTASAGVPARAVK